MRLTPLMAALLVCALAAPSSHQAQGRDTTVVGTHWDYPAASIPFRAEVVATGLQVPWGLAFMPNGSLLATDRATGRLYRIDVATGSKRRIEGVPSSFTSRDAGLLDIVVDPRFDRNGLVYLSLALGDSGASALRVVRALLQRDTLHDVHVLYTAPQPLRANTDHFGGRMLLADGMLYVTSGDRRTLRDSAQSLTSPLGKVLRLGADGAIPGGNPYTGKAHALPEIWTLGHRNPQGIARDPRTGAIWVSEHGPQGGDEVNVLERGANYGWPVVTFGEEYGGGRIGRGSAAPGMTGPVHHFTPSIAPSGLMFYSGREFPRWRGSLFMGALALHHVNRLTLSGTRVTGEERLLEDRRWRVRVVITGPDGLVYLGIDGGLIVRLRPLGR